MPPSILDQTRLVHAADRFVVVDKPVGVRSVPGNGPEGDVCVEAWVRARFPLADGPLTVHRLDMATSGLMVYALDRDAQAELSRQFMKRRVAKTYTALLDGVPEGDSGVIDLPMRVDWPNRPRQIVDHELGRPARTEWRLLSVETHNERACARVEFVPITGRSHQLRVHAAHADGLGRPILGDTLYADAGSAPRLLLHATTLAFTDPGTDQRIEFASPAPF
ncbi:MAG: RluA family pseudouridine synthase [Phycisphaerales bacterium]